MVDSKKGFVREEGSIQMELDFTIVKAKIVGEDDADQASSSKKWEEEKELIERNKENPTNFDLNGHFYYIYCCNAFHFMPMTYIKQISD